MKTMPAGEFKTHCLRVMAEVQRKREPVLITKKGRPVAKLVPLDEARTEVLGCLRGKIEILGDIVAPIFPAGEWEANEP
jgi:prevent-host-death family protein